MNERLIKNMGRFEVYEEDQYFRYLELNEAIENLFREEANLEITELPAVELETPKPKRRQFERIHL